MIVRQANGHLRLITQPDHAALARRIMQQWPPLHDVPRRGSILHAIEAHDDGWHDGDAAPSVDPATGRICDFITAPVAVRQGVWPISVKRLAPDDPWAAALVAQHALTIYDRYHGDPEWTAFFRAMTIRRDELLAATHETRTTLDADYGFVRIGDLVSLVFCNQWQEEPSFGGFVFGFEPETDTVRIAPDPFGGRRIPVSVTAREIDDRRYESDADLRLAVRAAPQVTLTGQVVGATS